MKNVLKMLTAPFYSITQLPFILFGVLITMYQYAAGNYFAGALMGVSVCVFGTVVNEVLKYFAKERKDV